MSELVKWSGAGGIAFYVNTNGIRGFRDLSISVSAKTDESVSGGESYVTRKNAGAYTITLTAILNAYLGEEVQQTAVQMAESARNGDTGYFYTGETKLFPAKFMMTDAKISDINMNGAGVWTGCSVALTLKQCSKYDGTVGNTSSPGKKEDPKPSLTAGEIMEKITGAVSSGVEKAKNAIEAAKQSIAAAKAQSAAILKDASATINKGNTSSISNLISNIKINVTKRA